MLNLNEKELLKLAAQALGIKIAYCKERYGHRDDPNIREGMRIVRTDPQGNGLFGDWWNPLKNDGDRYVLAKKLGLMVDFEKCAVFKTMLDGTVRQQFWGEATGILEEYAIVQVAADIGASMMINPNSNLEI